MPCLNSSNTTSIYDYNIDLKKIIRPTYSTIQNNKNIISNNKSLFNSNNKHNKKNMDNNIKETDYNLNKKNLVIELNNRELSNNSLKISNIYGIGNTSNISKSSKIYSDTKNNKSHYIDSTKINLKLSKELPINEERIKVESLNEDINQTIDKRIKKINTKISY